MKKHPKWLDRAHMLIGDEGIEILKSSHVLIVGLGGVGGFATESICRAGVGEMTIVDGDIVEESNRNRQLVALISTNEMEKAKVLGKRLLDINPDLKLHTISHYMIDEEMEKLMESSHFDYVIDAIDTLKPKAQLIDLALKHNLPIVSAMGAGGKFDPLQLKVADISKTYECPLAQKLRKRLKLKGIKKGLKVVFSPEKIEKEKVKLVEGRNKKSVIGTISYMPPLFGGVCASVVIRDLLEKKRNRESKDDSSES